MVSPRHQVVGHAGKLGDQLGEFGALAYLAGILHCRREHAVVHGGPGTIGAQLHDRVHDARAGAAGRGDQSGGVRDNCALLDHGGEFRREAEVADDAALHLDREHCGVSGREDCVEVERHEAERNKGR